MHARRPPAHHPLASTHPHRSLTAPSPTLHTARARPTVPSSQPITPTLHCALVRPTVHAHTAARPTLPIAHVSRNPTHSHFSHPIVQAQSSVLTHTIGHRHRPRGCPASQCTHLTYPSQPTWHTMYVLSQCSHAARIPLSGYCTRLACTAHDACTAHARGLLPHFVRPTMHTHRVHVPLTPPPPIPLCVVHPLMLTDPH